MSVQGSAAVVASRFALSRVIYIDTDRRTGLAFRFCQVCLVPREVLPPKTLERCSVMSAFETAGPGQWLVLYEEERAQLEDGVPAPCEVYIVRATLPSWLAHSLVVYTTLVHASIFRRTAEVTFNHQRQSR